VKDEVLSTYRYTGERIVPTDVGEHYATYRDHLARYVFAMEWTFGKKVLDAACGSGYGTALLSAGAREVHGVDLSEEALAYAARINTFTSPHRFYRLDLDREPIPEPYDVVVSFETIEHLSDPGPFLASVAASCREWFIFSIPLEDVTDNPFHRRVYTFDDVVALTASHFPGRPAAFWGQDTWIGGRSFQITMGLRAEGLKYAVVLVRMGSE